MFSPDDIVDDVLLELVAVLLADRSGWGGISGGGGPSRDDDRCCPACSTCACPPAAPPPPLFLATALSPLPPPLASELDTDGLEQLPSRVSALELDDPSYPPSEPELDDELLSSFMSSALLDAERRSLAGDAVAVVAVAVVDAAAFFLASVAVASTAVP